MRTLALKVPGYNTNIDPYSTGLHSNFTSLGSILNNFFPVLLMLVATLMIFWGFWGVFQYIFAGGSKEALGKARARITYAIIGFLFVAIAFALSQYLETIVPQKLPAGVTEIK